MKSSETQRVPAIDKAAATPGATRWSWKAFAGWIFGAVAVVTVLVTSEKHGPASPDNLDPDGAGKPLPVEPLLSGFDWVNAGQIAALVLFLATIVAVVWGWRRHPGHPVLLMVIASSTLFVLDPYNNWAIGLVYNPRLWHFPRDWPWLNISPIIEPLTSFVYAPYILLPYFVTMPILRAVQRRRAPESFVWRHPLISLAALTFVCGVIWDAAQEILLVRTQFLTYTHVIDFGTLDAGKNSQFPFLMASLLITVVMIPASLLLYRDDSGRSQAEKIARRFNLHTRHPRLATFLVMAVALNIAMFSFSTSFWVVRATGAASTVACPWPYPTAKTWDPHGLYESQGAPGPFTAGAASTWQVGQPDGRPSPVAVESDRCDPDR
ncbi:spirocyclase AveC family protein [Nocardia bovistercoris]|uniref:Spirocyclase AveC family protein n=1 Tax=Nocardia bovistercoris TaxID=2785916 RepID=A0A931IAJ9_9NOCA|nr:spirocyclase AveC family protein [Nocardia bovistercoris]MBH0778017.1 spirocyclase AveC family protein [Nocardia bovistercoris]